MNRGVHITDEGKDTILFYCEQIINDPNPNINFLFGADDKSNVYYIMEQIKRKYIAIRLLGDIVSLLNELKSKYGNYDYEETLST